MKTKHQTSSVRKNTEEKKPVKKVFLKRTKGQGLVEFAFVIPLFMLLLFGVVEFGRYLTAMITINTSSREAARYAAAVGNNLGGTPYYRDCTGIEESAVGLGLFASFDSIEVRYDHGPDDTRTWDELPACSSTVTVGLADRVIVHVEGSYTPLLLFSGVTIPLESTTSRTIVTKLDVRSTQYVIDTPDPEETPETDKCDFLSMTPVSQVTPFTYSFTVVNTSTTAEDFTAIFDELWFSHSKAEGNKYFDNIQIIDETDPANPYTLVNEYYSYPDNTYDFTFRPYNLTLLDPRTGDNVGVPPESTYRVQFSFHDDSMTWYLVRVSFFNVDCPLIYP